MTTANLALWFAVAMLSALLIGTNAFLSYKLEGLLAGFWAALICIALIHLSLVLGFGLASVFACLEGKC